MGQAGDVLLGSAAGELRYRFVCLRGRRQAREEAEARRRQLCEKVASSFRDRKLEKQKSSKRFCCEKAEARTLDRSPRHCCCGRFRLGYVGLQNLMMSVAVS